MAFPNCQLKESNKINCRLWTNSFFYHTAIF